MSPQNLRGLAQPSRLSPPSLIGQTERARFQLPSRQTEVTALALIDGQSHVAPPPRVRYDST